MNADYQCCKRTSLGRPRRSFYTASVVQSSSIVNAIRIIVKLLPYVPDRIMTDSLTLPALTPSGMPVPSRHLPPAWGYKLHCTAHPRARRSPLSDRLELRQRVCHYVTRMRPSYNNAEHIIRFVESCNLEDVVEEHQVAVVEQQATSSLTLVRSHPLPRAFPASSRSDMLIGRGSFVTSLSPSFRL